MNIKASTRNTCSCCSDEFILVPLDMEDLSEGDDGENPDLQLTIDEANQLIKKLQKLTTV